MSHDLNGFQVYGNWINKMWLAKWKCASNSAMTRKWKNPDKTNELLAPDTNPWSRIRSRSDGWITFPITYFLLPRIPFCIRHAISSKLDYFCSLTVIPRITLSTNEEDDGNRRKWGMAMKRTVVGGRGECPLVKWCHWWDARNLNRTYKPLKPSSKSHGYESVFVHERRILYARRELIKRFKGLEKN